MLNPVCSETSKANYQILHKHNFIKKIKLAFFFFLLILSCPSAGVWLFSSSAAALARAEGGNTFSVDYHAKEMPKPCSAAALLFEDSAEVELMWGGPPVWVICGNGCDTLQ